MSCEFCKGRYERLLPTPYTKKGMIGIVDLHFGMMKISEKKPSDYFWNVIYETSIRFCPMCGDALSPPQALTLEELRERDGKQDASQWVWIQILQSGAFREAKSAYYRTHADHTDGEAFCCGYPGISYNFDYAAYGISWIALDREPKEDA